MKSRLLYFILIVILIVSVLTGLLIWRRKHLPIYPKFDNASFTPPLSSKFIPRNADIVFHWKINPNNIPTFVESYGKQGKQNNTFQKVESILDTSFNLIGIDFKEQASQFAGEYGSYAFINDNNEKEGDWIIILDKKQDININDNLKAITNKEESKEAEESKVEYNSEEIETSTDIQISKSSDLIKPIYFCSKDNYILISSSSKLLELSLKNSKKNSLEQLEDSKLDKLKSKIHDGFALLEISSENVFRLLNQNNIMSEENKSNKLISSIDLNTNKLIFNGIIENNEPIEVSRDKAKNELLFNTSEVNSYDDFILINNPDIFFKEKFIEPYNSSMIKILKMSINQDSLPLMQLIGKNSDGPLIWLENDNNWAIISRKDETNKNSINESISEEKFIKANLEFNHKYLEVWSKLTTSSLDNNPYIGKDIMALIQEYKGSYIWSKSLSSISDNNEKEYFTNNLMLEDESEEAEKDSIDIIKIHLSEDKTHQFLQDFYPYIILRAAIGSILDSPKGMDIAIAIPNIENPNFLRFEISFKLS